MAAACLCLLLFLIFIYKSSSVDLKPSSVVPGSSGVVFKSGVPVLKTGCMTQKNSGTNLQNSNSAEEISRVSKNNTEQDSGIYLKNTEQRLIEGETGTGNTEQSLTKEVEETISEQDIADTKQDLLEDLELEDLELAVNELLGDRDFSFRDTVEALVNGEMQWSAETLPGLIKKLFVGELLRQKQLLLQILLLVLASSLLLNISRIFDKGQISEIAFYMVYLLIFVLLIRSFGSLSSELSDTLQDGIAFMEVLTPAYYLAIIASNGASTAAGYYEIVLVVIFLVQWLLLKMVLPGINLFVLLGIVNHLSKEDFLLKMAELLKTVMEWILKSTVALIVGMQVVQRMVSPMLDSLQRTLIGKTASAIPGIGNVFDSVTEMVLGCSMLIRNCVGAAALIVLLLLGFGPVIQLGITTLMYRALAAVTQPISDKRMMGCLTVMGEGCGLLLRVLLTAEVMFLVTVAIVASGGGQ